MKEQFWKARLQSDRSGPRMMKSKYTTQLITKDLYKKWLKNSEFKDLSYGEFRQIWEMIAYAFREEVVENINGVRLPFYTGDMKLSYVPCSTSPIDHKSSEQIGINVGYVHWSKNTKPGKIIWSVDHARKRNRYCTIFGFEAARDFCKQAAEGFTKNPEKYKDNRWKNFNFISRKELLEKYGFNYFSKKINDNTNNNKGSNISDKKRPEGS